MLEKPGAFNSANNEITFLSSGGNSQFLLEGIVAGSFMFIGAFFLYLIKDAAKERADRTQYYIKMFPSTVMVIISYLVLLQMKTVKLPSS